MEEVLNTHNAESLTERGKEWEILQEVEYRHLTPDDDLSRAAELLYKVDPYIFPDFFGDEERAKMFGPALFNGEKNALFSFDRTLVAEQNGKLLGILCYDFPSYPDGAITVHYMECKI